MAFTPILLLATFHFLARDLAAEVKRIEAPDHTHSILENPEESSPSCDLTENFCDINCCNDKDCNSWELKSFNCNEDESITNFGDLTEKECNRGESDPILCLHYSNTPYLGEFYLEPDDEDNSFKKEQTMTFMQEQKRTKISEQLFSNYQLDFRVPKNILQKSGFCLMRPVKFQFNTESNCAYTISEEACLKNELIKIQNYISPESLLISSNFKNITLKPEVICLNNGSNYITVSKNMFRNEFKRQPGEEVNCSSKIKTLFNKEKGVCENVVVGLQYHLKLNYTSVLGGNLTMLVANIPTNVDSLAKSVNQTYLLREDELLYLYVHQRVNVFFQRSKPISPMKNVYRIGEKMRVL